MLSQVGLFGSAGGFAASRPAWQPAHELPIRIGELSALGGCAGLNSGLGRLRMPTTPDDDDPSGSVCGQKSRPPVWAQMLTGKPPGLTGAVLHAKQSGSFTTPH